MLTLPTNSANFIGRLFFLVVTFSMCYFFINFGLKDANNGHVIFEISAIHFVFKVVYLTYLLIGTIAFLALTIITSLLGINKIQVNTLSDTITFVGLLAKKTITINDISEYLETIHRNPFKAFYGLLIKLKDDTTIQVAGQNIKSLSEFKQYLNDKKVNCVGQKE
jgi:hypothetical protein